LVLIYNMAMLPYATWFYVANAIAFPLGIYWGARLGRGKKPVGSDKTSE
ncbi:MAG: hypothetical protein HY290_01730, partial [Planctomycetia bacterium]|nr:hypothetical protein [Planctomycetia bacterium]